MLLERYEIEAEYTVTRHAVIYRFTYPKGQSPCLLLALQTTSIDHIDEKTTEGHQEFSGGVTGYFSICFDRPTSSRDQLRSGLRFHFMGSAPLEVRIGVSLINAAQGRRLEYQQHRWV